MFKDCFGFFINFYYLCSKETNEFMYYEKLHLITFDYFYNWGI